MRTHELASVLRGLSDVLSHLPDTEISSLPEILKDSSIYRDSPAPPKIAEKKVSARTTAYIDDIHETLTNLPKKEVMALISEADIPIEVQGKDSSKYAARKVRNYLTTNPASTRKVKSILTRKHSTMVSEPLSKALGILLGDSNEVSATRS